MDSSSSSKNLEIASKKLLQLIDTRSKISLVEDAAGFVSSCSCLWLEVQTHQPVSKDPSLQGARETIQNILIELHNMRIGDDTGSSHFQMKGIIAGADRRLSCPVLDLGGLGLVVGDREGRVVHHKNTAKTTLLNAHIFAKFFLPVLE